MKLLRLGGCAVGSSKRIKNLTTVQQDEFADIKDNNLKQEKRFQHSIDLLNDEIGVKIEQLTKDQNDSKKFTNIYSF